MLEYTKTQTVSNVERFERELRDDATFTSIFIGGSYKLNYTKLYFTSDITAHQSTLYDFFSNFTDIDNTSEFEPKILSLVSDSVRGVHFHDIEYTKQVKPNLYPKRTKVKGEVQKVQWYADAALTDLVLEVDIVYTRDVQGFATDRTTTRKWVMNNGNFHADTKVTTKKYNINIEDQIVEGKTRRRNIVNIVQLPVMSFLIETETPGMSVPEILLMGRAFMDTMELHFQKFIDNSSTVTDPLDPDFGKKQIVVAFEDATDSWMENTPAALGGATIRQYLIGEFSI